MLVPEDPVVNEIMRCCPWQVSRSHNFPCAKHVNLQELEEVVNELKSRVALSGIQPGRSVNITDSRVTFGACAKGRSSSFCINGSLRRVCAWSVVGQKAISNVYGCSADMPADDPSRLKPLRPQQPPAAWLKRLLPAQPPCRHANSNKRCPPVPPCSPQLPPLPSLHTDSGSQAFALQQYRCLLRKYLSWIRGARPSVPLASRACLELFAGKAGLTRALRREGLTTGEPFEAFPGPGLYIRDMDLDQVEVFESLLRAVLRGDYLYAHFGLVCTSWGPGGVLSGGTRRNWCIWGCPTSYREHLGNIQLFRVCVCSL